MDSLRVAPLVSALGLILQHKSRWTGDFRDVIGADGVDRSEWSQCSGAAESDTKKLVLQG